MSFLIISLVSISLFVAVLALIRERRICRAMQQILRRLVEKIKSYETNNRG